MTRTTTLSSERPRRRHPRCPSSSNRNLSTHNKAKLTLTRPVTIEMAAIIIETRARVEEIDVITETTGIEEITEVPEMAIKIEITTISLKVDLISPITITATVRAVTEIERAATSTAGSRSQGSLESRLITSLTTGSSTATTLPSSSG